MSLDRYSTLQTNRGLYYIYEIGSAIDIGEWNVNNDIAVMSDDGMFHKPLKFYYYGKQKMLRIRLNNGYELKCSPDTKLSMYGDIVFAKDLSKGDYVDSVRTNYTENYIHNFVRHDILYNEHTTGDIKIPNKMTEKLSFILGVWMNCNFEKRIKNYDAENNYYTFEFYNEFYSYNLLYLCSEIKSLFYSKNAAKILQNYVQIEGQIVNFLSEMIKQGVPVHILRGNESTQIGFINGLIDGICLYKKRVTLCQTQQEEYYNQLCGLLNLLGFKFDGVRKKVNNEMCRVLTVELFKNSYVNKSMLSNIGIQRGGLLVESIKQYYGYAYDILCNNNFISNQIIIRMK